MKTKQRYNQNLTLLAISVAGVALNIDPNSIPKDKRQVLHGEFQGTRVNSPALAQIGDSAVVWPDANRNKAFAMGKAELGVLSIEFLKAEGYTVTAPAT